MSREASPVRRRADSRSPVRGAGDAPREPRGRDRSASPRRDRSVSPRRDRSVSPRDRRRYRSRSASRDRRRSVSRDRGGGGRVKDRAYRSRSRSPSRDRRRRDVSRSPRRRSVSRSRSPGRAVFGMPTRREPPRVGLQVFVAGFNFLSTERDVERRFGRYGRVTEVRIVRDSFGKSRGFGFVAFETEEDARRCIDGMNGRDWEGRRLQVELCRNPK